jgi:hypothetical protein
MYKFLNSSNLKKKLLLALNGKNKSKLELNLELVNEFLIEKRNT